MPEIRNIETLPILDSAELSDAEREEFDYLGWDALDAGSDSASFFRYRGSVYDLGEFERASADLRPAWDEMHVDSFFSAVVVKYVNDNEDVKVGLYLS